jgi:hypothetical protein
MTFFGLVQHFIYDITHFDGKFFETLKHLVLRPGKVSKEFIGGQRTKYLDPIRMYLFTSAVFFLVFFAFKKPSDSFNVEGDPLLSKRARLDMALEFEEEAKANPADTTFARRIKLLRDTSTQLRFSQLAIPDEEALVLMAGDKKYKDRRGYDSLQNTLPAAERDGWIKRNIARKTIELDQKYRGKKKEGMRAFLDGFFHKFPYMLFLSLPFFAAILKLLYVRRKQFLYSDHAIFTIHHYIFSFILLLLFFSVDALRNWLGWGILGFMLFGLIVWWILYLVIGMKNFYGQGWGKTILKFMLLNFLGLNLIILLFFLFLVLSVFQL